MEQQGGLFGFLEKYLMGPMGKIAQYKIVRAITAAGMGAVPFTIVGSMFLVLVCCHNPSHSGQSLQIFLQLHLISSNRST